MPDLNDTEVRAAGQSIRVCWINIPDHLVAEVRIESLNGLLEALDAIVEPDVANIEPLPIIVSDTARQREVL